jgi:hypothetical protein
MPSRLWVGALVVLTLALLALWFGMRASAGRPQTRLGLAEQAEPSGTSTWAQGTARPTPAGAVSTKECPLPPAKNSGASSGPLAGGLQPSGRPSTNRTDGGGLYRYDADGLNEAMRSAMPEIDRCYEDWLRVQPALGGRMKVRFTIATDDGVEGQVTQVSVGDAGTGNIAFEGCVLSVISALRFEPPLNGEVTVTYPLAFIAPPSPPKELQSELVNLCRRIRSEAQRAELANIPAEDLLTAVLANLKQQTPELDPYFSALLPSDVPPIQRLETFKRAISAAIGTTRVCPEFDSLWAGKPI